MVKFVTRDEKESETTVITNQSILLEQNGKQLNSLSERIASDVTMIENILTTDIGCNVRAGIKAEISQSEIEHFLTYDEDAQNKLIKVIEKLYEKDKRNGRNRSLEQITFSAIKGFYCEMSVYYLLATAGFTPRLNEIPDGESYSARYNYDITYSGVKIEIEAMPLGNTFFSYTVDEEEETDYLKVKNFRQNWYDYDMMIAVKTDYHAGMTNARFIPWVAIDPVVFQPSRELFVFRKANERFKSASWFLKMDVCERQGLMRRV